VKRAEQNGRKARARGGEGRRVYCWGRNQWWGRLATKDSLKM